MRRVALIALTLAFAGCDGGDEEPGRAAAPPPRAPTATPAPEAVLAARPPAHREWRYTTARLTRRAALRAAPGGRTLARAGRWTEFGGRRVLAVTGRRGAWLRVVVPERRNGGHAWIRSARVRTAGTDLSLHVDRSAHELTVRRGDRVVRRITVGTGLPGHETPLGRYAITDKLHMDDPDYGCCALALSGHQTSLPAGWTGLDRLAIHGTDRPETIGADGSYGCLHARNEDLRTLMRTIPLGAPVFITS
jgi:hypothetical protein